jgi:AraC-like DNA-binding protein
MLPLGCHVGITAPPRHGQTTMAALAPHRSVPPARRSIASRYRHATVHRWATPPAPDLRDVVALYWHVADRPDAPLLLPPEVSVDLVLELEPPTTFTAADGTAHRIEGAYLSGTRTGFHRVDQHGVFRILAVRFQPWAIATTFGCDPTALVNRFVDPPPEMRGVVAALSAHAAGADAPTDALIAALDGAVRAAAADATPDAASSELARRARLAQRARRLVEHVERDPGAGVRALADALGVSVATLERIAAAALGMTPKEALRITRHNRTWAALQAPGAVSWVQVSAEVGYADQSHFIREFRAFTGTTPARYLRERSSVADRYRQD